MRAPSPDFLAVLLALAQHQVEFLVVGGVSALLQGASIVTFDLDVVHLRSPENIDRLLSTLGELDAVYRGMGDRTIRPDPSHLKSKGRQLLLTRFGPLVLLGTSGNDLSYEDLLEHTLLMTVCDNTLRVLNLETLIKIKEELGSEKDRASIPILRRVMQERSRNREGVLRMIDLIKKTIMAGLGAVVLTTEKVHEVTKRFVVEGKLSTEEAEKLADELVKSGEEKWDEASGRISEGIRKGIESVDLVRMKEFEELKARVEKLEAQLADSQPETKANPE